MKYLFIFAHPDDETFTSGGTIAKLTKSGNIVKVISATKGEAGDLGDPPVSSRDKLGEIRVKEQLAAAKILGVNEVFFLNLPDGTLAKLRNEELVISILSIIKKEIPDTVVTFDKNGVSNHPDHIAISKAATVAYHQYSKTQLKKTKLYHTATPKSYLEIYEQKNLTYSAFGKQRGLPDHMITTKVRIDFEIKDKASRKYKSQHKDWERFLKRKKVVDLNFEFFLLIHEKDII